MTNQTRTGDEIIAAVTPHLDVVLDEPGCIVLCTPHDRVTITNAGELAQALLKARLVQEAREQDWWGQREAEMTHRKIARAAELGRQDAVTGDYRDMDDGDSAWLMDMLGETEPTTEANHLRRIAMCDAYATARKAELDKIHDGHISCTPEGCVTR